MKSLAILNQFLVNFAQKNLIICWTLSLWNKWSKKYFYSILYRKKLMSKNLTYFIEQVRIILALKCLNKNVMANQIF